MPSYLILVVSFVVVLMGCSTFSGRSFVLIFLNIKTATGRFMLLKKKAAGNIRPGVPETIVWQK